MLRILGFTVRICCIIRILGKWGIFGCLYTTAKIPFDLYVSILVVADKLAVVGSYGIQN